MFGNCEDVRIKLKMCVRYGSIVGPTNFINFSGISSSPMALNLRLQIASSTSLVNGFNEEKLILLGVWSKNYL